MVILLSFLPFDILAVVLNENTTTCKCKYGISEKIIFPIYIFPVCSTSVCRVTFKL